MHSHSISPIPATIGVALLIGAIGLQIEDALRSGHWATTDYLSPAITVSVVVAGVLAHHRLARWRISGLAFLLLALLGSAVIVYSSLARTATQRDTAIATAMAENRTLTLREEELTTARALAKQECRVAGPRYQRMQSRADQLISQMAGLRAVATDPRSDALAKLAELLGGDAKRTRAIVSAIDPAVIPILCEVMCVLMLIAGIPGAWSIAARKCCASVTAIVAQSAGLGAGVGRSPLDRWASPSQIRA